MPLGKRRIMTGGEVYVMPWLGPVDHTTAVRVTAATLTAANIDAYGYLPPGFPLAADGTTVGGATGVVAAGGGNTGNGTVTGVTFDPGMPAGVVTLTATDATHFNVVSSVRGSLGVATTGVAFNGNGVNLTVNVGGVAFVAGDTFTVTVTAGDRVYGATLEAVKIAESNAAADVAAAGPVDLAVGTIGQLVRQKVEDNLGRALTADEVAGFVGTGVQLV